MIRSDNKYKNLVEDLYSRIKDGLHDELTKIELKIEWFDLRKSQPEYKFQLSKFLKELTGIANTFGLNGYLIIGLGKEGNIVDAPFKNSGLKDYTQLYDIVVRGVDRPINFEIIEIQTEIDGKNKTVTIIDIPPSIDKPHVMREYLTASQTFQNYIPVRKNTGVFPANRSDLDLMYYDNKNIVPEYDLNVSTTNKAFSFTQMIPLVNLHLAMIFENAGRRPLVLVSCVLTILQNKDPGIYEETLKLQSYRLSSGAVNDTHFDAHPIVIPANNAVAFLCNFSSFNLGLQNDLKEYSYFFSSADAVGNSYKSKIFMKK